jgi:hypothetical protein
MEKKIVQYREKSCNIYVLHGLAAKDLAIQYENIELLRPLTATTLLVKLTDPTDKDVLILNKIQLTEVFSMV